MRRKMFLYIFFGRVNRERSLELSLSTGISNSFLHVSPVHSPLFASPSFHTLWYSVWQYKHLILSLSLAKRLRGSLDRFVIQIQQWDQNNPRHISIMLLAKCRGRDCLNACVCACKHTHTHACMSLSSQKLMTWGKKSQFEALLHIQHPQATHTSTHTQAAKSWVKVGEQSILRDRKWYDEGQMCT